MKILLLSAAALVVQMFVFLCLGSVVLKIRGREECLMQGLTTSFFR